MENEKYDKAVQARDKRKINQDKCIKCGTCIAKCPFHAIG